MDALKVILEQARADYTRALERYGTLYDIRALLDKEIANAEKQMETTREAFVNAGLEEVK